jgi:DNA-binding transcriptional MerR regulator
VKATEQQIPDKLYFRIGEVSDIVGVKPYVLRYWESEFSDINPTKSKSGQRLYKRRDVELLLNIKQLLYEERFTINGARKRLKELGRGELVANDAPTEHVTETEAVVQSENISPQQLDVFAQETAVNPTAQASSSSTENRKVLMKIRKDLETILKELRE